MRLIALLRSTNSSVNFESTGDVLVSGLSIDSRKVRRGHVFFAIKGNKIDGANFAPQAEKNGAIVIIADAEGSRKCKDYGISIPVVVVENVRKILSIASKNWFGRQPDQIVAVTGTNGKTSVASFLKQIWDNLSINGASIGTLGLDGIQDPGFDMTTPDPLTLHECLSKMVKCGVTHVVLEASSHGLTQNRLDNVNITSGAFTNLSRDHLDYHGDFESYFLAKARLFTDFGNQNTPSVINVDDYYGRLMKVVAESNGKEVYGLGKLSGSKFRIVKQETQGTGQLMSILYDEKIYNYHLNLMGAYQGENAAMAAALAVIAGASPEEVFSVIGKLISAKGRLECVKKMQNGARIFIDYAHSPEALKTLLIAVRPHTFGALYLVFGAGGDRDKGKRQMMGEVAQTYADTVFLTDDNPRSEPAEEIRRDVKLGCPSATEIGDRAKAIFFAISELKAGDNLIVAGKGHENGQIIGDVVYPFDDTEQVSMSVELLEKYKKI